ncbi:outer membrane protein assembly factor BamA [Rickettsiales bacterium]|nr:outer membrane protein assembly factor BamA [Rickettsiales bacterium]
MSNIIRITFIFLCFLALSTKSFAYSSNIINDIVIKDNQRIESATIKSYLDISEGDIFNNQKINNSIKKLFATGLFANVSIEREKQTLMVIVKENPTINKVAFEGNKQIKQESLSSEISLRSRSVYTRNKVQNDVKRIQALYRKSGRFSASIVPKVIPLDNNRVDLVFEINEGEKSKVKKIYFLGNDNFSTERLKKIINTKQTNWYSFINGNDAYDPDKVSYDRELLRRFYVNHGYADFKVTSTVAEISKDKETFVLTFTLEEGGKYKIGEININSSLKNLKPEEFKSSLLISPDDTFNSELIEKTVDNITEKLNDRGYAFVEVSTSYNKNPEKLVLDLNYNIKEGPKVYIDRINITGNVRTLDKVIRREFRLAEGDPFNSAKLRRTQQRIRNLGFFENVNMEREKGTAPDKVDINLDVTEKSTGELNFGAGFSTIDGMLGNVGVRERNLLGRGQDLRLSFQKSAKGEQIDLGFTEPYFMDKDISAGFDLFNLKQDRASESSYDSSTRGGALRASYSITEHLRHSVKYSFSKVDITNVAPGASAFVIEQRGENTTSMVGHSLLYDKRDNTYDPTEGYFVRFSQDVAGVGGDSKFFRNEIASTYYHPIYKDVVIFSLSGKAGTITGIQGKDVRINHRFFLGGHKIRGFKNAGLGPRDKVSLDALGGNSYYTSSAEVFFPLGLPEELGFKGSAFVDAGSLFDVDVSGANVLDNASLRVSAGVGLSWNSPLGPIRIDLAEAFMRESYDKTQVFQLNFGTRF